MYETLRVVARLIFEMWAWRVEILQRHKDLGVAFLNVFCTYIATLEDTQV
jgi:hypothetical protein